MAVAVAVTLGKLNLPQLEVAHGSYFCEEQRVKKNSGGHLHKKWASKIKKRKTLTPSDETVQK